MSDVFGVMCWLNRDGGFPTKEQVLVFQRSNNAIHRINLNMMDNQKNIC